MTKNNTVEKIDEIINKIEENVSNISEQDEIQAFLENVDDDLVAVKISAEGKQKEIVVKKVEELRNKIDGSLEWKIGRVKVFLNKDVKGGLNELKNEIIKSEEVVSTPIIMVENKGELENELNEWKKVFPGKTAEDVSNELKFITEQSLKFLEKLEEVSKESNTAEDINKLSQEARKMGEEYVSKIGQSAIPVIGPLVGSFYGAYHGTWMAGLYTFDRVSGRGIKIAEKVGGGVVDLTKEGMEYVDDARKDLKDLVEHMADNTEKLAEQAMNTGGNVAIKFVDDIKDGWIAGADLWKEGVKQGVGVEMGILKAGIGMGKDVAVEKELEISKELIADLKNQLNEKTVEIERLQKQIAEQSSKGQENLLNVIEMITKAPSRPSTPTNQ